MAGKDLCCGWWICTTSLMTPLIVSEAFDCDPEGGGRDAGVPICSSRYVVAQTHTFDSCLHVMDGDNTASVVQTKRE